MKGTSQQIVRNRGRLTEANINIDSVEYEGREIHHATVQFVRADLNCQWGRNDWEVGWFEDSDEAVKMGHRKYRELTSIIRAAYKLPRRWMKTPNGERVWNVKR